MHLAFCLYHYFPYGGLQRDMLAIANECIEQGQKVTVLTSRWQGKQPDNLSIIEISPRGLTNHTKINSFAKQVQQHVNQSGFDIIVGFNKMPGLDIYYMADICLKHKLQTKPFFYPYLPRYKHYLQLEASVFSPHSQTRILSISEAQTSIYQTIYHTPTTRFYQLPPGINPNRLASTNTKKIRENFRHSQQFIDNDLLILFIGSAFRTKGLDRAIRALAELPEYLQQRTHMIVVGSDNPKPYLKLAKRLHVAHQLTFLAGRNDIPHLLVSADLLIHPAYFENTGTVLLEAAIAGLPVLTTSQCGFSHYIQTHNMGHVLPTPFKQTQLNQALASMLVSKQRQQWQQNGINFGKTANIYAMPLEAAKAIIQCKSY